MDLGKLPGYKRMLSVPYPEDEKFQRMTSDESNYFVKPFDMDKVMAKVRETIG